MDRQGIYRIFMNVLQTLVDILYEHHSRLGITYFQLNDSILTTLGQEYLSINTSKLKYFYFARWGKLMAKRLTLIHADVPNCHAQVFFFFCVCKARGYALSILYSLY